ncbi:DUF4436 domain-containing protein [Skermania sp. ID1734]|uniref:DUF4436 family protein n=1 Tax=Skermania sp. ID1734 TaxID=2597516 RepID=UPI00117ED804|nr:DUF4436 family protein [Skermania sp. ID1734]TSE00375.1 DUF4436 domain-containing protein [Skermania sp. ID1734]
MKTLGIVGLVVAAICVYLSTVALYAFNVSSEITATDDVTTSQTRVRIEVQGIEPNYQVLNTNLTLFPAAALLNPADGTLQQDVTAIVTSGTTPIRRTFSRGITPGTVTVPLTLSGNLEQWPFDSYHTGTISAGLLIGGAPQPIKLEQTQIVGNIPGWSVDVKKTGQHHALAMESLTLHRSEATIALSAVVVAVLLVIATLGMVVAIQTLRGKRKFQPPMTTWYAAMLFAVVPLRNALPGSPPFGSWIDIVIVLWVIASLVIAMLIYIVCWWRHLRLDPPAPAPKPAQPAQL